MAIECTALSERFANKANSGVVDVKFFIKNIEEATTDVICAEITALLDARERGDSTPLRMNDGTINR